MTVAPARAKRSEMARPMPRVPPVIKIVLLRKENRSFPLALMQSQYRRLNGILRCVRGSREDIKRISFAVKPFSRHAEPNESAST